MSKRLSKTQLIAAMAEKWGISKKDASEMYDKLIELIYGEVKRCGEIMLPGLGKMAKKHRAERMGRNPATGETIKIPAKSGTPMPAR